MVEVDFWKKKFAFFRRRVAKFLIIFLHIHKSTNLIYSTFDSTWGPPQVESKQKRAEVQSIYTQRQIIYDLPTA